MNQIENKLHKIDRLYELQRREIWINALHPLVKLLVSFIYIIITVSIGRYGLDRMILMAVYIFIGFSLADISFGQAFKRVWPILPLVVCVGIFNPIFDRTPMLAVGGMVITAGWISMITLMLKGIYAVLAAYLLIATTSVEEICYALRVLHLPKVFVTVLLLISRYITTMGEEVSRMTTAYHLRAPSQKGIHYKAWGSFVGQWMLRSFDKAERIYEAMQLRGFTGEFSSQQIYHGTKTGLLYLLVWTGIFLVLRFVPLFL